MFLVILTVLFNTEYARIVTVLVTFSGHELGGKYMDVRPKLKLDWFKSLTTFEINMLCCDGELMLNVYEASSSRLIPAVRMDGNEAKVFLALIPFT
jgi:hypothetical protein